MDDETREQRANRRKREQEQREMEYELSRDLKLENDKREIEQFEHQHRNKYADKALIFVSTLALLYLLLFILDFLFTFFFGAAISMLGISVTFIYPFLHAAIWIMAILSALRGRSVLDDLTQRFF